MSNHISPERLNDFLDGLLTSAEREEIEAHVVGCAPCRDELARVGELVTALRGLPASARPPEEVWTAVEARIRGTSPGADEEAKVLSLNSRQGPRRFHFTVPQLAAAAIVVSLLSSATVWLALSGDPSGDRMAESRGEALTAAAWVASVEEEAGYADAVAKLERIVAEGRGRLDPETIAALDQALQNIDQALADVRRALAADPSSGVLGRMLTNHQMSKLRVLRQAASAVQAVS